MLIVASIQYISIIDRKWESFHSAYNTKGGYATLSTFQLIRRVLPPNFMREMFDEVESDLYGDLLEIVPRHDGERFVWEYYIKVKPKIPEKFDENNYREVLPDLLNIYKGLSSSEFKSRWIGYNSRVDVLLSIQQAMSVEMINFFDDKEKIRFMIHEVSGQVLDQNITDSISAGGDEYYKLNMLRLLLNSYQNDLLYYQSLVKINEGHCADALFALATMDDRRNKYFDSYSKISFKKKEKEYLSLLESFGWAVVIAPRVEIEKKCN